MVCAWFGSPDARLLARDASRPPEARKAGDFNKALTKTADL
jgi:hypothetical protein